MRRIPSTTVRALTTIALVAISSTPAHAARWWDSGGFTEAADLKDLLADLDDHDTPITAWTSSPGGAWMVVANSALYTSTGWHDDFDDLVDDALSNGKILALACNADDACIVVSDNDGVGSVGTLPTGLKAKIEAWEALGIETVDVAFDTTSWVIVGDDGRFATSGADADLVQALGDLRIADRELVDVAIGFDGSWMLMAGNNPMMDTSDSQLRGALMDAAQGGWHVKSVLFGPGDSFGVYAPGPTGPVGSDVWTKLEYGLGGGDTIWQRMEDQGIPGMSIAVVEGNEVIASRGYGSRNIDEPGANMLGTTPVDIGSTSKFIGALTTLAAMEDGVLDIDDDIVANASPVGFIDAWMDAATSGAAPWGVAQTPLPAGITPRRLLAHAGGIEAIKSGSARVEMDCQDPVMLKSSDFWLRGNDCLNGGPYTMTLAHAAWLTYTPGSQTRYSGPGILLAQAYVEEKSGKRAWDLMEDYLFDPMGMDPKQASGVYPIPSGFRANMAEHHDIDSNTPAVRDPFTMFPWTFAGGVNISPWEYAKLIAMVNNEGVYKRKRILETASVEALLSAPRGITGSHMGLGVDIDDDISRVTKANGREYFHEGWHGNRSYSRMCGIPGQEVGMVIMMAGSDANIWVTRTLGNELRDGWIDHVSPTSSLVNCR